MNLKRNLGISFIFLAIIISAVNINITGAVIGSSLSNSFSFVAIIFLVVGVLLMNALHLDDKVQVEKVYGRSRNIDLGSYRRWRERKDGVKYSEEEVIKDYDKITNKYWTDRDAKIIKNSQDYSPLKSKISKLRYLVKAENRVEKKIMRGKLRSLSQKERKKMIKGVVEDYNLNRLTAIEAGIQIDDLVPIKKVNYTTNKDHSISGSRDSYIIGLKSGKKAEELALVEYLIASKNNPTKIHKNVVQISGTASTKHHMGGFIEILEDFKSKNEKDLNDNEILSTKPKKP